VTASVALGKLQSVNILATPLGKMLTLCNLSAEEEIDGGNCFNRLESWI
jgi:hypothetical protein